MHLMKFLSTFDVFTICRLHNNNNNTFLCAYVFRNLSSEAHKSETLSIIILGSVCQSLNRKVIIYNPLFHLHILQGNSTFCRKYVTKQYISITFRLTRNGRKNKCNKICIIIDSLVSLYLPFHFPYQQVCIPGSIPFFLLSFALSQLHPSMPP